MYSLLMGRVLSGCDLLPKLEVTNSDLKLMTQFSKSYSIIRIQRYLCYKLLMGVPMSRSKSSTTAANQDLIKIDQQRGVVTLTLNAASVRNAFDDNMIEILNRHLNTLKQDPNCRILVLRGEGEHFSAGANIQWMKRMAKTSQAENHQDALKLAQLLYHLNNLNKPTIALVQGSVYGGAMGLIACCDIVLADPNTRFCFSEVKIGLVPAIVCPYILNAMGPRAARRYMLTAEPFEADTALKLGLVHEVLPQTAWQNRLQALINMINQNAPRALGIAKNLILTLSETHMPALSQVEYTSHLIAELRVSKEGQEGLSAFLEKRKPNWESH